MVYLLGGLCAVLALTTSALAVKVVLLRRAARELREGLTERLEGEDTNTLLTLPPEQVVRSLDREALSRVLGNILSNALKYSAGDLRVTLSPAGSIAFSNSALELTAVTAQRLFDRYFTVETGRRSTGLGLAIARRLTEAMGGTVEAAYQDGTLTVIVDFPENF